MRIYLIQHGMSLPEAEDPEKSLSLEGKNQTQRTAEFLESKRIKVDLIWNSPKKRAVQTAQIISEKISPQEIQERSDMNPLDPVDKFPEEIKSMNRDIMLIGHLPFLQKLFSLLLTGSEENDYLSFKNSGIICLECTDKWRLTWAMTPDLL